MLHFMRFDIENGVADNLILDACTHIMETFPFVIYH